MASFLKKYKFFVILIPLGLVISFVDSSILDGFLASSEVGDHYLFVGILLAVVICLIFVILKMDKNSNS